MVKNVATRGNTLRADHAGLSKAGRNVKGCRWSGGQMKGGSSGKEEAVGGQGEEK